jgi:hypothetical protein
MISLDLILFAGIGFDAAFMIDDFKIIGLLI